jgi:hypothetical protein
MPTITPPMQQLPFNVDIFKIIILKTAQRFPCVIYTAVMVSIEINNKKQNIGGFA